MHNFGHTQTNIGPCHCKKHLRQSACCAIYSWHTSHSFDFALATMSSKDPSVLLPDFFAQISLPCMSECSCSVCKVNNSHSDHEQIKCVQWTNANSTLPRSALSVVQLDNEISVHNVDECTSVQCVQCVQMRECAVCANVLAQCVQSAAAN